MRSLATLLAILSAAAACGCHPCPHGACRRQAIPSYSAPTCAAAAPADSASAGGDRAVRFAVLGDRTGSAQPDIYEAIVAEVQRLRPDFVITVGDMIEGPAPDSLTIEARWSEYESIVAPLSMPLYLIPGNNDIWNDTSEAVYRSRIGPPCYSFDRQGLHFAVLDASRWFALGDLPRNQWDWLRADLAQHENARCTFLLLHVPYWYDGVAAGEVDSLHALCVHHGVDAVFTGHYHDYFSGTYDGIRYTGIGSSGGHATASPHGWTYHYAWVTVDDAGLHIAPIKYGSVMAWDEMTATARRTLRAARQGALRMPAPLEVASDLRPSSGKLVLQVDNSFNPLGLADTLRWEIPDGWSLTPAKTPVQLAPGDSRTLPVTAHRTGSLYPLPEARLRVPYAPGESEEVRCPLRIARQTHCVSTASAPLIDGVLSENCWREPVTRLFSAPGEPAHTEATAFFFARDPSHLYLAVRCRESLPDSLRLATTAHDGPVYADDCVGYFIAPDPDDSVVYQIYFSASGVAFDQRIWRTEAGYLTGDPDWDGEYEVAAGRDGDAWTLEIRMPIAQLGAAPVDGAVWGLNFRRKQPRLGAAADWQVPIDYDPSTYGHLIFR